jgi:hypothetical protein
LGKIGRIKEGNIWRVVMKQNVVKTMTTLFGVGYVRQTYDIENEERLWNDSMKIVGMNNDM